MISPSMTLEEISVELQSADDATMDVEIPPGLSLRELRDVWKRYGWGDSDIDRAYAATYDAPILATRPEGASLEGYIFPDTYQVYSNADLEDVIQKALDEFSSVVQNNDLEAKFKEKGISFYEGLTLASIVELEERQPDEQKNVAQVFYNRLAAGMNLGSDVTYRYAFSNGLCLVNSPECDSVFNTRNHGGFPPSPVANVNEASLVATANPSQHDYLFFVMGDDGTVHYSKTEEEHTLNTALYCVELCQI
jgi:UPF0755 protein